MRVKQRLVAGLAMVGLVFAVSPLAAAQYSSPNYRVEEAFFGTGGEVDATSASYRSQQGLGALGVGAVSSANYDAIAGFITPNQPFLEMTVSGATVDLGVLSTSSTASGAAIGGPCSCSFTVRTYLSSNYVVLTMSQPPTSEGGAVLNAKPATGAPSIGTEEFGINLVDNISPNVGTTLSNQPDNSFADGQIYGDGAGGNRDYDDVNEFAYGAGDAVAHSAATAGNPAIGQTNYTVSYIDNMGPITEAGLYTMNHDIVVVATY